MTPCETNDTELVRQAEAGDLGAFEAPVIYYLAMRKRDTAAPVAAD